MRPRTRDLCRASVGVDNLKSAAKLIVSGAVKTRPVSATFGTTPKVCVEVLQRNGIGVRASHQIWNTAFDYPHRTLGILDEVFAGNSAIHD
jgi:hypothetical protein